MCTQQMGFLFALSVVGLFNNSPLNYDIIIVTTNEVGEQFFGAVMGRQGLALCSPRKPLPTASKAI